MPHAPHRGEDEYAAFARVYDLLLDPFLAPLRRELTCMAIAHGWTRVLDVGGGAGRQCQRLSAHNIPCLMVDASPSMLRQARANLGSVAPMAMAIQGDAARLPIAAQSVDAASFSLCLHEMEHPLRLTAMAEARRVAKSVVLADYAPRDGAAWFVKALGVGAHLPERLAGRRHYAQYRDFLARGGVDGLLREAGYDIAERRPLFGGVMVVAWAVPVA